MGNIFYTNKTPIHKLDAIITSTKQDFLLDYDYEIQTEEHVEILNKELLGCFQKEDIEYVKTRLFTLEECKKNQMFIGINKFVT